MGKILIGVATAALWFALSHAANADQVCRQACDKAHACRNASTIRIPTSSFAIMTIMIATIRTRPGVDIHVPGIGVDIDID